MKELFSPEEIRELTKKIPLTEMANKKGILYKERREELDKLSEEEFIIEMSKEPRLIRRPIIITEDQVIVGYDESIYKRLLI
jgi:arsenate reductase